jgi:hypothetical protein
MDKFLNRPKRDNPEFDSSNTVRKSKHRKYDESYMDYGFTYTVVENEERPQCVICFKVMAVETMLPNKMKRHLETVHQTLKNKPRTYFESKLKAMREQKTTFAKHAKIPSKALLASYRVAYQVAKCKKPHTIAEQLILPAAMDMVSIMLGEAAAKQLMNIPLSDTTISRRILDLAEDINDQLIDKLKGKDFSLQLDEATDNNNDGHLICYVRFIDSGVFHEDLLFCRTIKSQARAVDLFQMLDSFITENNLMWEMCCGICTDGARSMSGCYNGLQALIKKKAPFAVWTHCIIHREALASKSISPTLDEVLQSTIKIVNFVKTRPLKSRCFEQMCVDMGSEHTSLLYYCNSRWLSRGNVVARVFELRKELHLFLLEHHEYHKKFEDTDFLTKLSYLSDIFSKLNILNKSLQGNETHIFELLDKITAFQRKLVLWKTKIEEDTFNDCFPTLHTFLRENDMNLNEIVKNEFIDHLSNLKVHFEHYFPQNTQQQNWIKDPFNADLPTNLLSIEQEQWIDVTSDSTMKTMFGSSSLTQFWTHVKLQYTELATKALKNLTPFATSYLCETGFSALAVIKTKYRSKVNVEKEMRIAISKLEPRFEHIIKHKQAHPSH